ncbi:MAG TPA: ApaG domain, partial [Opitutae bacterium]|nr:ApaG domain [Opitutae bacterium]
MMPPNEELEGLNVTLDRLTYYRDDENLPKETPHAFIYHLSIHNHSQRNIMLMARKWVIQEAGGNTQVIEGDKIVGKTPALKPGQTFSYNSYHVIANNAQVEGSFHRVDEDG